MPVIWKEIKICGFKGKKAQLTARKQSVNRSDFQYNQNRLRAYEDVETTCRILWEESGVFNHARDSTGETLCMSPNKQAGHSTERISSMSPHSHRPILAGADIPCLYTGNKRL